jgi:hypothetical protein
VANIVIMVVMMSLLIGILGEKLTDIIATKD